MTAQSHGPSQNTSSHQQNSRVSTDALLVSLNGPSQGDAFGAALAQFKYTVPDAQLAEFKNITYDVLCKTIGQIQSDQDRRRQLMGFSRIARCLEALHQLGKVVEVFVNVSNVVAFIWGPMKFLLLTSSEFVDSFEALLLAYEQIGEHMPLLLQYQKLFASDPLLQEALKQIYIDILEFHGKACRFFSGALWKRFFRSMWKGFETKFSGTIERLKQHRDHVERCAGLAHFQKSSIDQEANLAHMQTIQADVLNTGIQTMDAIRSYETNLDARNNADVAQWQKHHDDVAKQEVQNQTRHQSYLEELKKMDLKLSEVVAKEKDKRMSSVRVWLAIGSQLDERHASFVNIRMGYPSTTKWIMKHEAVDRWLHSTSPATPNLWINGIPGAGKTILASAIVDECKNVPLSSTCFFYCREDDYPNCSAVDIMRALIDQLLVQHSDLLPPCYTRRTTSGEPTLRSFSLAIKMLEDLCLSLPKVFIVIDGLDEYAQAERKQALEILLSIVSQCEALDTGKLRLLVVSQEYLDIRRTFFGAGTAKLAPRVVQVSHADNESDITVFVRSWVDKVAVKFELDNSITEYLINLTVVNAKGMFLFAKLVMHNLFDQPTRQMLLEAIENTNFPTGLQQAYGRILSRIKTMSSKEEWTEATKLLGWMVCAKRRLTWKEMQIALSIDVEGQSIDYKNKRFRRHIQEICGSLVSVHGDRVFFVHSTAKTFITRVEPDVHVPTIECDLSVLCLQYLTLPCFEEYDDDNEQELKQLALDGFLAFQDYAVSMWFHHVMAFVNSAEDFLARCGQNDRLESLAQALDEFMAKYSEEDWGSGLVEVCKAKCCLFEHFSFGENLTLLTSHVYTFQERGFDARHKISILSLEKILKQNRKLLEELPAKLGKEKDQASIEAYSEFYDAERLYKCNRITCRYFSDGFSDKKSRKHHVNIHDRPFHCEVRDCLGAEGFAKDSDLRKHMRAFHPEQCDLADTFRAMNAKRGNADHACTICGKTFTRSFHRKNHEASHRGERPFSCPECGKAFTRANDCKRHQKIHERGSK